MNAPEKLVIYSKEKKSAELLKHFKKKGFVVIKGLVDNNTIQELIQCSLDLHVIDEKYIVYQGKGKDQVRAVFSPDLYFQEYRTLLRNSDLISMTRFLFGQSTYLHQYKIIYKPPIIGEGWRWHQDSWFTNKDYQSSEKNRPNPETIEAIQVAIFLDKVENTSGPLLIIPGTHKYGLYSCETDYSKGVRPGQLKTSIVEDLASKNGIISILCEPGTVVFFDSNLVHSSQNNLSCRYRRAAYLSLNSIRSPIYESTRPKMFCRPYNENDIFV